MKRGVFVTANASGAAEGARQGDVVMIVDVISMSTTLEAALDVGAEKIFGASPDLSQAPVDLDPEAMGFLAGQAALAAGSKVLLVTEPRIGSDEKRRKNASKALAGITRAGAELEAILPNIGAETVKLANFKGQVILAVTDTGGVAFDAAFKAGAPEVITGTIARTTLKKGFSPARAAARRAMEAATRHDCGITIVAASANSLEDVLAAEYIARTILEEGFLALKQP